MSSSNTKLTPPTQWYWYIEDARYLGLAYWDGDDYTEPTSSTREVLVKYRGEFDTPVQKATADDAGDNWEVDSAIPDDIAWGIAFKVIAELYLNKGTTNPDEAQINLSKARMFESKHKDKLQALKRHFGRNRRKSAGHISPYDLR